MKVGAHCDDCTAEVYSIPLVSAQRGVRGQGSYLDLGSQFLKDLQFWKVVKIRIRILKISYLHKPFFLLSIQIAKEFI